MAKKNKKVIDEWKDIIDGIEQGGERYWNGIEFCNLSYELQKEIKLDIAMFLDEKKDELEELRGKFSDLSNHLEIWEGQAKKKLRYIEAVNEIGAETVEFMRYVEPYIFQDRPFNAIISKSGYWDDIKISKMKSDEKLTGGDHLNNATGYAKKVLAEINRIISENPDENIDCMIKEYVIPVVERKISELEEA